MQRLKFYKESDSRWYVDLPEWTGDKSELELVSGADHMLEYIAQGDGEIWITFSRRKFTGADKLIFLRPEIGNGAFYKLKSYRGIELDLELWLCDVTKFVFGDFPKVLYLTRS